jgi:hypothetical protein
MIAIPVSNRNQNRETGKKSGSAVCSHPNQIQMPNFFWVRTSVHYLAGVVFFEIFNLFDDPSKHIYFWVHNKERQFLNFSDIYKCKLIFFWLQITA